MRAPCQDDYLQCDDCGLFQQQLLIVATAYPVPVYFCGSLLSLLCAKGQGIVINKNKIKAAPTSYKFSAFFFFETKQTQVLQY